MPINLLIECRVHVHRRTENYKRNALHRIKANHFTTIARGEINFGKRLQYLYMLVIVVVIILAYTANNINQANSKDCLISFSIAYLKEQYHTLAECLKIVNVVDTTLFLDVHEERHAEYGKNKHY